jgi:hypothetical protein
MGATSRFLMSPAQHRAQAALLRRGGMSKLCELAVHHERLADIIEKRQRLAEAATASELAMLVTPRNKQEHHQ